MPVTDITTLDAVSIESAPVLNRDCAFAVSDIQYNRPKDDIIRNMPVAIGEWEDGAIAPYINGQGFTIDPNSIVDADCDSPEVSSAVTTCYMQAPAMADFSLTSPKLKLTELIPLYCKQRGFSGKTAQLRSLIGSDGMPVMGNPYYMNYMQWAYTTPAMAIMQWVSEQAVAGDTAVGDHENRIDGLFTQLVGGWTDGDGQGAGTCGDALNLRQTINWNALTSAEEGPYTTPASPDAVTVADKTVTLWGTTYDVPAGLNLAQFLEKMYFPKVESMLDGFGAGDGVLWEAFIGNGTGHCFLDSVACMAACDAATDWDPDRRDRFAEMRGTQIAQFYPSGRQFPLLESPHVTANSMWIGPRQIGGNPTYGLFFQNIDRYFNELGMYAQTYAQGSGRPMSENTMLREDLTPVIQQGLDSVIFHYDTLKVSDICIKYTLRTGRVGVLAVSRHLWLEITMVDCPTWISDPGSELTFEEVV